MLPALGLEFEAGVVGEDGHLGAVLLGLEDAADAGDGDAGDGAWDFGDGGGGEEELVVFATVKDGCDLFGVGEGGGEGGGGGGGGGGGARDVELGGYVGGGAEVGEVGGEAVGEINAGCCEVAAEQGLSNGEVGLGKGVR
jgi:hypothetical protein